MTRPTDTGTTTDAAASKDAARWVVRMTSDQRTRADDDQFEQWLRSNPVNAQAYEDHLLLWDGMAELSDNDEARAILDFKRPAGSVTKIGLNRRAMIFGTSAAAAAVVAAVICLPLLGIERYETEPGEQRRVILADGSSVMLNTGSRVLVDFSEDERHIYLENGQAYFDVAKDAKRPFRVFAGQDEIRAIGTAFDVRFDDQQVHVVLEEGVVAIYRAPPRNAAGLGARVNVRRASPNDRPLTVMQAGQQARLQLAGQPAVAAADVVRSGAWRYGQIILDESRLGEAVDDMNRYGGRRIVLAKPEMANLTISGVFHTKRPEAFVDGVTAALALRVASEDANTIILAPVGPD